jgi:Ca-activated chloride channel family protein
MIFANAWALVLIPVFLIAYALIRMRRPESSFIFPTDDLLKGSGTSVRLILRRSLSIVRVACIVAMMIALARPQVTGESKTKKVGIAAILCLDCSSTMLAEDMQLGKFGLVKLMNEPTGEKRMNRLDAAKSVAGDFIRSREDDMIGIVAFAAQAYPICPPTFDQEWMLASLDRVKIGLIKDATAIGSAIMTSISALEGVNARSKIIILLTDGINNFGKVPPLVAAKAARSLGIKIYTIGIASRGQTPYPVIGPDGRKTYENVNIEIDDKTLRSIADMTGGAYYRVSDLAALKKGYEEIDRLERVELEQVTQQEGRDVFHYAVAFALALLVIEIALGSTFLRKIP